MGRTACTEPQCLYKDDLYLYLLQNLHAGFILLLMSTGCLWYHRDSALSIATGYGFYAPGIESRGWGCEIFQTRPDQPWGPPSLLYNANWLSFPEVKRPGRGVDHPPPSSADVKEKVELYLYSPSGPSWPVLGWPLPLPFTIGFNRKFHVLPTECIQVLWTVGENGRILLKWIFEETNG